MLGAKETQVCDEKNFIDVACEAGCQYMVKLGTCGAPGALHFNKQFASPLRSQKAFRLCFTSGYMLIPELSLHGQAKNLFAQYACKDEAIVLLNRSGLGTRFVGLPSVPRC